MFSLIRQTRNLITNVGIKLLARPLALQSQHFSTITCSQAPSTKKMVHIQPLRQFHAVGSRANYLDFRYKVPTNHLGLHMLKIRRQKMKKHQKTKWRKKFKCLIAKSRLKREILKEKTFRVELLSMIRLAERFDPREFALRKIAEVNSKPRELTKEEKLEELKELIRIHRHQVEYVKPKHKKLEVALE